MSATVIGDKGQVTLPQEVREAAGLAPGDHVEWRFEAGSIHGRKLDGDASEVLDLKDVDPNTLLPTNGRITAESLAKSIRADRDRQK